MEQVMPDFITYLTNERNASKSTVSSYCRDLERMFQFLDGKGIKKTDDVTSFIWRKRDFRFQLYPEMWHP